MRKLVVFDLDQTLIDTRYVPLIRRPHNLIEVPITVRDQAAVFVYMRPRVRLTLQICRGDRSMSVALFSAGEREYVYKVIDQVIIPNAGPDFYFDAIYCKDDLDAGGVKNIGRVKEQMHADRVLLVDDLLGQCIFGANPYADIYWYNIPPFDAEAEDAESDNELLHALRCPFFSDQ